MRSSSSQYCRKSLPLTSALLPSETKLEIPMPARVAAFSTAMPTAPDCEASAIGPGTAFAAPKRRIEANRRIGVDDADAVRPDDPHPVPSSCGRQLTLAFRAFGADFGEAATDHDQPASTLRRAVGHERRNLVRGDGDDAEVDHTWDLGDRSERGKTFDGVALRVHRIDRATKSCLEHAVDDFVADGAGAPAGADHGDRFRPHEVLDRSRLGDVLSVR